MMNKEKSFNWTHFFIKILFILISAFLFFIANPNPIVKKGFPLAGWFIYLPVLILLRNCSIKNAWIYGVLYGLLSYGSYGYWLNSFHPLGLIIVCICYSVILAVVFTGLKFIELIFNKNAWLVQWIFICSYEYIKTCGFIGFSYGVTAYTQWTNLYFIQIADLIGVFGLNLLVIFPSTWLSNFISLEKTEKKFSLYCGSLWLALTIAVYVYGFVDVSKTENKEFKTLKVVAVQNNEDPWKNGLGEYSKNIQTLKELTDEALDFYPDIDFVLWPETAVVPSVMYQYYKLVDENRFRVIYSLLNYIDSKKSIFIIGNSHEEENKKKNTDRFNNSLVFEPGKNVVPPEPEMYSKIHLVPFTESFPYKYKFPGLYIKLLAGDTHMWTEGSEYKVFNYKDLYFSTPICFEDTFGNDCRQFVKNGARCFMNMSNDSWSKSSACQYQHLAMSVFRSVENRVPTVRSTSSGQTCIIDYNGKIVKMIPEFCEGYVVGDIPLLENDFRVSVYTSCGDLFGKLEVGLFFFLLIIQIINVIIKRNHCKSNIK